VGPAAVDDAVSCAGDFLVVGELGVLRVLGWLVAHERIEIKSSFINGKNF
jgi:hypothetical protein